MGYPLIPVCGASVVSVLRPTRFLWEKAMAPHSSILAWKIPWTEGPGGLKSTGSLGVGHDLATSLYFFTFMHWRRKWQPTPVFLPGESQGPGCRLWGRTESDMTEAKRLSSSSSRFLSPWDSSSSFLMINIMYH